MLPTILNILYGLVIWAVYGVVSTVKRFFPDKFYKNMEGETVLITGAGSGIGRLTAQKLAAKGAKIVSLDVNQKGNEETVKIIRNAGGEAFCYKCDLSDREDVYKVAEKVKSEHGPINMLINNAGIVSGNNLLTTPDNKIELTFKVNTLAHFWTVKAFLPDMLSQKKGHIVNIASLAGTCGAAKLVDYCSSKFAAVGFHDALKTELHAQGHSKYIKTTVVCPYFINTGMFEGVQAKLIPILNPDVVVDTALDGILTNADTVYVPGWTAWVVALRHFMPNEAIMHFGDILGTSTSMDEFSGRKKQN